MIDKYIRHAQLLTSSTNTTVANFANTVYTNAVKLKDGIITKEQFNDGVYIAETDLESSSINNIKKCIIQVYGV